MDVDENNDNDVDENNDNDDDGNDGAPRRVAFILSKELVSSLLPSNRMRSNLSHSLISSLGLLKAPSIKVYKPVPATRKDLVAYHTPDYVDHVLDPVNSSRDVVSSSEGDEFGLEDDCPPFYGLHAYVPLVAGASLTAADILKKDAADVSIAWDGGRHHAQKSHASGFCYVADCILATLSLKRPSSPSSPLRRPKIMYLDLDLHFSDAVSHAFHTPAVGGGGVSPQVLTLSIHHTSPGFFPLSPLSTPLPTSDPFTLSIPLLPGASSPTFHRIWTTLVEPAHKAFSPEYVVVQCGVDGLAGDPYGVFNWCLGGEGGLGWCVGRVMGWEGKKLVVGGGGYNSPNAARAWAYLTSIALARPLPLDTPIPDHPAFPQYAPSFTLDVPAGNMRDMNTDEYLREVEGVVGGLIGRMGDVMGR
ncbi:hypothetical protein BDV98DRAFT_592583 [Pterulicium gracile]|uniref:Histone deacetylase 8 n=1 Tax=Pterulicium gracile TaxID=1884261 RepID=A0A5C3QNJ5_9AGAR|nr:hypothetical protein BDV98DRAFT_592583 [Pterula gracilis]